MNPNDTSPAQDPQSAPSNNPVAGQPESRPRATAEKVRRAAGRAKEKVTEVASEQKDATAEKIGRYSSRLRDTARSAEDDDPNIAHFANQAADRLESVASYVRDADFAQLKQDAASVARRHPALFMGGMLVAGLVAGNLAKASVQSLHDDEAGEGEDFEEHYADGNDFPSGSEGEAGGDDESGSADREFSAPGEASNSAAL
jgi:hypothetical protein